MEGRVVNYRIGPGTQNPREIIVVFKGVERRTLHSLIGKKVCVLYKGKEFKGRIVDVHGRNAVRVRLRKGIPGQALGSVVIVED